MTGRKVEFFFLFKTPSQFSQKPLTITSTLFGTNAAGKIGRVLLELTTRMLTRRKGPKTAKLLSAHFFHIFPVPRNYLYETIKKNSIPATFGH